MDQYLSAMRSANDPAADPRWAPGTPAEEDAYYERNEGPILPAWLVRLAGYLRARPATATTAGVPQRHHVLRHI
jgi:hypothetical protein